MNDQELELNQKEEKEEPDHKVCRTWQEAEEYVTSQYWVLPVHFPLDTGYECDVFSRKYVMIDTAANSNEVHYIKK